MLLDQLVKVSWNGANKKYYVSKGYSFTTIGDEFEVDVNDLSKGSHSLVKFICDYCNGENQVTEENKWKTYKNYLANRKNTEKDCCSNEVCRHIKMNESKSKNMKNSSNSLAKMYPHLIKEWSIKNQKTPWEYGYGSEERVWWICEKGHEWESNINNRSTKNTKCPYCLGKIATPEYCLDATHPYLSKEWHHLKNGSLMPKDVTKGSQRKVWWIGDCGHEWKSAIHHRVNGRNCPYCVGKKVDDSNCLATTHPKIISQWDFDKNMGISPYSITGGSSKFAWWICKKGHSWNAQINSRALNGNGCPQCKESKGEKRVRSFLENNNIDFLPQYEFNNLIGLGGKNLRFDFVIFDINKDIMMLIEYDGEFHFEKYYEDQNFETQQLHDKLKNDYCNKNNIKLIRIPYWDFDRIEEILEKELVNHMFI